MSFRRRRLSFGKGVVAVLAAGSMLPALTSGGVAAGAEVPSPTPPTSAMLSAMRAAGAVVEVPGATPRSALSKGVAGVDEVARTIDTSGCAKLAVITSRTGSGGNTTVSLIGAPNAFKIGAVPASWYTSPPTTSAVWQLYFRGFYWASELAPQFANKGDKLGMQALLKSAGEFHRVNPDRGASVAGWDEGTNLRRQEALNCLYRASGGDLRIAAAVQTAAKSNLDVNRYYGLPKASPHNHGLLANLALLDSADLLHRSDWRIQAANRLVRDSGGVFTPAGLTYEQSAAYHQFNTTAWTSVADLLATYPEPALRTAAADIRANVTRASAAIAHLVAPNGATVPFGDGVPDPQPVVAQPSGSFRDDAAGVITGRWSWTDSSTSYYLFRYGGPRRFHGHQDRTSLVWHTRGVPVLVDPGTFTYDASPFQTFARDAIGHNTQAVKGRALALSPTVNVTSRTTSGSVHSIATSDAQYGLAHARRWSIDHAQRRVTLTDTVAAAATTTAHLDQRWTLRSLSGDRRSATFVDSTGRTVRVTGTSPMSVVSGSANPVLGWQFPKFYVRLKAPQIRMDTPAGKSTMTFTVS